MVEDFDISLTVNCCFTLVGQIIVVAKGVSWLRRRPSLQDDLCSFFINVWNFLQASSSSSEEVEASIDEMMELKRLKLSQISVMVGVAIAAVRSMETQVRFFSYFFLSTGDGESSWRLGLGLLFLLWSYVALVPRLSTKRTLPCFCVLSMAVLSISVLPVLPNDPETLLSNRSQFLTFGVSFGLVWLRTPVVMLGNALFSICFAVSYAMLWTEKSDLASPIEIAWMEASVWVFETAAVWVLERAIRLGVRKELEEKMGECQLSGVMSLLGLMCDVVLDLDCNLALKEHSQKLAGILMHGTGKSLEGALLTDFVVDGDQQLVRDFTMASQFEGGPTAKTSGMFIVRVRDSMGNSVKTHMYHVPYYSGSGQLNHLIGLLEDGGHSNSSIADLGRRAATHGRGNRPMAAVGELLSSPGAPQMHSNDDGDEADDVERASSLSPPAPFSGGVSASRMPAAQLRPEFERRLNIIQMDSQESGSSDSSEANPSASRPSLPSAQLHSQSHGIAETPELVADALIGGEYRFSFCSDQLRSEFDVQIGDGIRDLLVDPDDPFITWLEQKVTSIASGQDSPGIIKYGYLEVAPVTRPRGLRRRENLVPQGLQCRVMFPAAEQDAHVGKVSIKLGRSIRSRGRRTTARSVGGGGTRARSEPQALLGGDEEEGVEAEVAQQLVSI